MYNGLEAWLDAFGRWRMCIVSLDMTLEALRRWPLTFELVSEYDVLDSLLDARRHRRMSTVLLSMKLDARGCWHILAHL